MSLIFFFFEMMESCGMGVISSSLLEEGDGLRQESALKRGVEAERRVLLEGAGPELRGARIVDGKGSGA